MANEAVILCGGAELPLKWDSSRVKKRYLRISDYLKDENNILLKIDDICESLAQEIPDKFLDLLDIATYVFCADRYVSRGGEGVDDASENWQRHLIFYIPVRNPDIWKSQEMMKVLKECLGFLSDDSYDFIFFKNKKPLPINCYIKYSDVNIIDPVEEVVLFSGGLDSLGGAIQECVINHRKIALVSHRSSNKIFHQQKTLIKGIRSDLSPDRNPKYIPVNIIKGFDEADKHQRARSFLYASLAATVAVMFGLSKIRFYENGIVSINLPISSQSSGSKATRSTHPKVLNGFGKIYSLLVDDDFTVENPFFWMTKTDVIELIKNASKGKLIKETRSCNDVFNMTKEKTHCGICAQCIERRLSAIAAGCSHLDSKEKYIKDIFIDDLSDVSKRTALVSYYQKAKEYKSITEDNIFDKRGELCNVIGYIEGGEERKIKKLSQLYQRHGQQILGAIAWGYKNYHKDIVFTDLPDTCLLKLYMGEPKGRQEIDLSESQKRDFINYDFKCHDRIIIPGTIPIRKRNDLVINDHNLKIGDWLFILLLRFVVELKKGGPGWVHKIDLEQEGIIRDASRYHNYDNLKRAIEGSLLEKDGNKFIEKDGAGSFRISTHPDFITYIKDKLINHLLPKVRELALKLPDQD